MMIYDYVFSRDGGILPLILDKNTHGWKYYKWKNSAQKKLKKEKYEEYDMDGLKGYFYPIHKKPSGKIAFLVHGYRGNHTDPVSIWRSFYKKMGYDVFCPDNPAAGNSKGKYIGYDYFESQAALKWIDYLIGKFGSDIKIILHGFSLGGASVVCMCDRVPDNVKFIVDDCGFSGGNDMLKLKLGPLYEMMRKKNIKKAGYDLKDTDTRIHLRNGKVPILFVHGVRDKMVPFSMGLELYTNCIKDKDCLFVDEAAHMESYYLQRKRYEEKIENFIKKYC